jgi:hypothetical protein
MSRSRHQRYFDPLEERYLIETLGDARHACIRTTNGDLYKALQKLTEAIDDVCVASGRKREYFWLKSH